MMVYLVGNSRKVQCTTIGGSTVITACNACTPIPGCPGELTCTSPTDSECSSSSGLEVKVLLEGPYDSGSGLMNDGLRTLASFPLDDPYPALGYVHTGINYNTTVSPSTLAVPGTDAVVDWVVVELRSASDPAVIVQSRSALLQRDGDVVEPDGVSPLYMPVAPGAYHVAVHHRNHLAVMTAGTVSVGAAVVAVDLTKSSTDTHGTNARKSIGGAFPAQVLWAGDVSGNGEVRYTGDDNDRDRILIAIGGTVPTNTIDGQYRQEDLNLNGQVQYTGDGNDRDVILQNIGGTVPTEVRNAQLP